MKKSESIRNALQSYCVDVPEAGKYETIKKSVSLKSFRFVPPFSPLKFLKSQLITLRPIFYICNLIYIVLITAICLSSHNSNNILPMLCAITPFITISALPGVFFNNDDAILELESSCLYKPKTALAGRLVICGFIDLTSAIIASLICSLTGEADFILSLVFSLFCFTFSSTLSLAVCLWFKSKSTILLLIGFFVLIAGVIISNEKIKLIILSQSVINVFFAMVIFAVLCVFVTKLSIKKYNFERIV